MVKYCKNCGHKEHDSNKCTEDVHGYGPCSCVVKFEVNPCDWCDREAGVEVHKLNSDRICNEHYNAIIEAIADDLGFWI